MRFAFDQLTYRYFSQDDKNFQRKFTAKQEFREFAATPLPGPLPTRGEFYPHQTLGERFLNIWDQVLFYNEPGTGKTGIIYAAAISFHKNSNLDPVDAYLSGVRNHIVQTIVIVPNDTLQKNWINAYSQYSGFSHLPSDIRIERRDTFYLDNKDKSDATLIGLYKNTFFAIDEVHELLNRSNPVDKHKYEWYKRLFWILPNCVLALLTGTAIIINPSELGLTMNLFPGVDMPTLKEDKDPNQKKKTVQDDPWWLTVTEDELASYIGGRVSHLKNVQTKSLLVYPPEAVPINELIDIKVPNNIKVVPVTMSLSQSKQYYDIVSHTGATKDQRSNPFNVKAIGASLSIIPNDPIFQKSIESYHRKVEKDDAFAKEVAAKLYEAVLIAEKSPGILFIVSRYVEKSGNVLEHILAGKGYKEYTLGRGKRKKNANSTIALPPKKKHYIAIRAQNSSNASLLDLAGQYDNRHGDYIKIVLTARVGSLGVTVNNAHTYISLDPGPHLSDEEQREKRVIRPGASDDLYNEARSKGLSHEDSVVRVAAYRLVAIPVKKEKGKLIEHPEDSIDLKTYRSNIEKDLPLHRVRVMTTRIAYDAQLQIARNQCFDKDVDLLDNGLDFDELDLTECYYGYHDRAPREDEIDKSTYDLLYTTHNSKFNRILKDLVSILSVEGSITVNDFKERGDYDISIIGLYKLISAALYTNREVPVLYNDYGIRVYLGVTGDTLFLLTDLNFDMGAEKAQLWPETYIYSNLIAAVSFPIELFLSYRQEPTETVVELDQWLSVFDSVEAPIERKIETIESIIVDYHSTSEEMLTQEIIDRYELITRRYNQKVLFQFDKPTSRLLFVSATENSAKLREKIPISELNDIRGPEEEPVLLHVMYSQYNEIGKGKYDIFKSHLEVKQITLFDFQSMHFIRLRPPSAEFYVYSNMIRNIIEGDFRKFLKPFKEKNSPKFKIYGLVYDPSADFKIYDERRLAVLTREGKINKATEPRGKSCSSYDLELLVDVAIALGIEPDPAILDTSTLDFSSKKELTKAQAIIKDSNKLTEIVKTNKDFYAVAKNLILLANWASLYFGRKGAKNNGGEISKYKTPMCDKIFLRLQNLGQLYFF